MPEIIVKLGDSIVQKNIFVKETIRIGRIPDNEIVVENVAVSRYHAVIEYVDERYLLTDLESSNGSFVNGVRVKKTELQDRDVITIGKHKLYFYDPRTAAEFKQRAPASAPETERPVQAEQVLPPPQGKLEVVKGKHKGARYTVENNQTSIGRGSFNDIHLTDWLISKVHAVIERRGNEFIIRDPGSWRHTYVNGMQVEEMTLTDGDNVQLGPSVQLVFNILREEQPLASKARIPVELAPSGVARATTVAAIAPIDDGAFPSERTRKEGPLKVIAWNRDEADEARRARYTEEDEEIPERASMEMPESRAFPEAAAQATPEPEQDPEPDPVPDQVLEPEVDRSPFPALWEWEADPEPLEMDLDREPAMGLDIESGVEAAAEPEPPAVPATTEEPEATAAEAETPGAMMAPHANGTAACAAEPEEPASEAAAAPAEPADPEQEIQMWERALKNKNPIIRKQAARQLQKLTGKQYDYS